MYSVDSSTYDTNKLYDILEKLAHCKKETSWIPRVLKIPSGPPTSLAHEIFWKN